jgi:hypothetical protein
VAASAHVLGAEDSVWRTDLAYFNASDQEMTVGLKFLASETDNSEAACVDGGTVAAWASAYADDVVLSAFALDDAVGGIAVYGSGSDLIVMSRTFNLTEDGTFGQTIPGREASEGIADGDVGVLMQLHENNDYRTNVGFLNTSGAEATVTVEYYAEDGAFLGSEQVTLRPYEQLQLNRAFTRVTAQDVVNGRVEIAVSGGPVMAYASVVDNGTSDPSYIEPR